MARFSLVARSFPPTLFDVTPNETQRAAAFTEKRFLLILGAVCLLGLICRIAVLSEYLDKNPLARVPINDAITYWKWAARVAGGQLIQDVPFFSAPLYPYLLGLIRWLSGTLVTIYVIQMLADVATAALVACVCRDRFGARVGLLAAGLFLLLQEPASMSLRVLPASLHLMLVTITWAALVRVQSKPSAGRGLVAGAAVGMLCLAYPPAMLLVLLVPAWRFFESGRRVRDAWRAAAPLVAAVLVICPATLHNWWASGDLFSIQAVSGITLRLGNHPGATGVYAPLAKISTHRDRMHVDAARVYRQATGKEPTWAKVDRYFRDQTLQYWRSDPAHTVKLAARKLYWFLSSRNYGDIYHPRAEVSAGLSRRLRLVPLPIPWLVGPALVGLALMLRRPIHHAPEWMLFLVPLLVTVVFWYSPRFRMPAVPVIVVAAAWAVERALRWRLHWGTTVAVTATLGAGILAGVVNRAVGFDLRDPASLSFDVAHSLKEQGNIRAAVDKLREGLRAKADDVTARIQLGLLLHDLGRLDEALLEFQRARAIDPADARALHGIGTILMEQQRFAEAEETLSRMAEEHPDDAGLLGMLAASKQRLRKHDEACRLYEQALELDPENVPIRVAYGNLLLGLERWDEARKQFTTIIRASPATVGEASPATFHAHHGLGIVWDHLGDIRKARTSFERALQIQPHSVDALHALGVLNVREGRLDEATEYLHRALAVDPGSRKCREVLRLVEKLQAAEPGTGP